MEIDFEGLSLKELREIRARVDKAIATFDERRKREAASELEEIARRHGYSLAEIVESLGTRKRSSGEAKYANPANADETWTGRGRKPGWMVEALANGRSMEDLAI